MPTNVAEKGFQGKVIIIGGGIAGNALGLFLCKAGVPCAIYEAYGFKEGVGGGLGLAPNGMNVLAALGLAEAVKARGTVALENCFYNERGRVLARFETGAQERYGQPLMSVLRAALYDVLNDAVQQQGIPLEFEKRLVNITQTDQKVIAHFADGTQAEGDLLIGADGINSQTRQIIMPNAPKPELVGIVGIGGIVAAADVRHVPLREKQGFSFTYGARGFFGYSGTENGDMQWWSNLPSKRELTRDELTNISLDALKAEMLAIYGGYHEPIETLIRHTHSPVKHNIKDIQSLPTWQQGRVLLIGDAAHAVSPNSGQGASLALEDTMLLAKLLAHSSDYQQVFTQFEQERKPRVEKIIAEGRRIASDKAIVTPFQQKIREIMMSIFINLFGIRGMDWMYRYKIAWD